MTTKIKWRLGSLPTPEEITLLLAQGVLTKDEAREILFSLETDEDRDKKSLQEEIKFLRELVQKLSNNQTTRIIETIREVQKPWQKFEWYQPYYYYANAGGTSAIYTTGGTGSLNVQSSLSGSTSNAMMLTSATGTSASNSVLTASGSSAPAFTQIKTF